MSLCTAYRTMGSVDTLTSSDFGGSMAPESTSFEVPGLAREIRVKIATEAEEFEGAFELLAANYRARGYEPAGDKPFRFCPHHALPGTVTLVAEHDGKIVATLSLVPDTDLLGLPMESIYGEEVVGLRREGRRMAEAICLADTGLSIREFVQVFKSLIKLAMQYHTSRGGDTWVIVVNPRHAGFYQKVLGFEAMGPQRSYPSVQNAPAVAYLLDSDLMKANAPAMFEEVFGEDLPEAVLSAHEWSVDRVRYFGGLSSQVDEETLDGLLESIDNCEGSPRWF